MIKFNSYQKGFVHILVLIIIVLIGIAGIGYFAFKNGQVKIPLQNIPISPTPFTTQIDTSSWKTYTNTKYSYQVKYPDNWFVLKDNDYGFRISNKYFDPSLDGATPLLGEIFIDFYYSHSALENYSQEPVESISTEGVEIVKHGKFIDNSDSFGIVLTYRKGDNNLGDAIQTAEQILSTFHFNESTFNSSPINLLQDWLPNIKWQNSESTFMDDGKGNPIPGMSRQGEGVSPDNLYLDSPEIHQELIKIGWINTDQADGPGGGSYTYTKTENGKKRILYINYRTLSPAINNSEESIRFAACPCSYEITVSLSD